MLNLQSLGHGPDPVGGGQVACVTTVQPSGVQLELEFRLEQQSPHSIHQQTRGLQHLSLQLERKKENTCRSFI